MKFEKIKLILIFSLFAVLAVSGCVGQSQSLSGQNGLVIRDLYTDPAEDLIKVGEPITIYFSIENVGAFKARNVRVELSGANWAPPEATRFLIGDINPPDPITDSPGGLKPVVLKIPAPVVPEGTKVNFPLKIRVIYDYASSASVNIPGYSEQRYQRELQQGTSQRTVVTQLNVQQPVLPTPIKVSLTGPDKLVVPRYPYEEFNYHITFTNVGDGVPITNGIDGLVYGGLWVTGPGTYFTNCLGVRSDLFASNPYWSTTSGVNDITNMWDFYYSTQSTRAQVRYGDDRWGYAFDYVNGGIAIGVNSVNSFVNYPTMLDWQYMGQNIEPVKLRTGTRSVTRPCTIAIDNQAAGGWEFRETDTVTLNFDLRFAYYIEKDFGISVTAPIIKFRT